MDIEHLVCAQLCFRNWRYTGDQARCGPCPTKGSCLEKLSGKVCMSKSWRGRVRREGRRCQRERGHGHNGHVKEALRVFQGGREQGLHGGDRWTDGIGLLRTGRETGLNNSELLKRFSDWTSGLVAPQMGFKSSPTLSRQLHRSLSFLICRMGT